MPEEFFDPVGAWIWNLSSGEDLQPLPGFFTKPGFFCDPLIGLHLEGSADHVLTHRFHLEQYGVTLYPLSRTS